jgi:hypothetical protein
MRLPRQVPGAVSRESDGMATTLRSSKHGARTASMHSQMRRAIYSICEGRLARPRGAPSRQASQQGSATVFRSDQRGSVSVYLNQLILAQLSFGESRAALRCGHSHTTCHGRTSYVVLMQARQARSGALLMRAS